ncbi:LAMI_0F11254g1_1 [Lachancea mirantina]|uniref:LAMI_0F11254g1_1 n=1 Tax=Lachancea mirantina TaxID=1230905 RepID=A0A1G4K2B0_9SACH|nr:LAMI_0F11254g1_1 [Lachancea mirantina]
MSVKVPNREISPENRDVGSLRQTHELTSFNIQDKVLAVFFTTRSGLCLVKILYELACGRISLVQHRKWQQKRQHHGIYSDDAYKKMVKKWTGSLDSVSLLLDVLARNENVALNLNNYTIPEYKLPLICLLDKANEFLIVDEEYNLLLDFLSVVRPSIEKLLNEETLSLTFYKLVATQNRVFELSGRYIWYTFDDDDWEQSQEIIHKYLCVLTDRLTAQQEILPHLQPLFDEVTSTKNPFSHARVPDGENSTGGDSAEEQVYSFDLNEDGSLVVPDVFAHNEKRHEALYRVLGLAKHNSSPLLRSQFFALCGLVDPVTQPSPNDSHIISIDLLSDMFLGLLHDGIRQLTVDWRFHVCFNLQKIINATLPRLNCDDFQRLNSVNNSDENIDWRQNLHKWLPHGFNTQDLELVYMIDTLAIYLIHKLYSKYPIQMNPFLAPMISLWKNLTFVVLLGLEIDRFEEEQETFETPVLVRATIRGASALRSVIATVLNGHVEAKLHDFKHEPVNIFMSPHGRKLCHGALYADVRSHAAAMLSLGVDLEQVTKLLSDLQPGDRFDEDVKYMFDYEFENYNEVDTEHMDEEELEDAEARERIKELRGYYKRCHCTFDDDEMVPETETGGEEVANEREQFFAQGATLAKGSKSVAFRSHKDNVEFDVNGRDWRDIPRGLNFYFNEDFIFEDQCRSEDIFTLMKLASKQAVSNEQASLLVRSVATCVKKEQELTVLSSVSPRMKETALQEAGLQIDEDVELTTDLIYEKWCEDSLFEKILHFNEELGWRMMDEMLMCSGYRRVLIWFITHLKISGSVIQYIYQLVVGLRGSPREETNVAKVTFPTNDATPSQNGDHNWKVPFSRQGSLLLSSIEVKMLFQEFLTNSVIFFSRHLRESQSPDDLQGGEDSAPVSTYILGVIRLMCFMFGRLLQEDKIDLTDSEFVFELQTLLMNSICIVPEARDLFFALRAKVETVTAANSKTLGSKKPARNSNDPNYVLDEAVASPSDLSIYNQKLISLLPPPSDAENTAVAALRHFITKHSLTSATALFGRRVVSTDDQILPMYMTNNEMNMRDFLAEFGIDYFDVVEQLYAREENGEDVNNNIIDSNSQLA